ncbi:hypothetical protein SLS62_008038 [Diatrype stigma]|uniref:C2H2-type domain-containing protein n=1 Tax=Diatrype stigma TaxID=117547 RepID=A0AAN9UL66_9PEZI
MPPTYDGDDDNDDDGATRNTDLSRPQRHQTLPPAQTSSARAALQSFYCDLCSKGYSRMNDYEAHLSSYDHSHRQRMKDMKQMVKDPTASSRARKAEAKADGLISIKLGEAGGGGGATATGPAATATTTATGAGFKKSGFKKSGFKSAFAPVGGGGGGSNNNNRVAAAEEDVRDERTNNNNESNKSDTRTVHLDENVESDTDDEGYEVYDPRRPTD